jgi:hypothetical protein
VLFLRGLVDLSEELLRHRDVHFGVVAHNELPVSPR